MKENEAHLTETEFVNLIYEFRFSLIPITFTKISFQAYYLWGFPIGYAILLSGSNYEMEFLTLGSEKKLVFLDSLKRTKLIIEKITQWQQIRLN